MLGVVAMVVLGLGAVSLLGNDQTRSASTEAAPNDTSASTVIDTDASAQTADVDETDSAESTSGVAPPDGITEITQVGERWFALNDVLNGALLLSDDGLEWTRVESRGPGRLLALSTSSQGALLGFFQRRADTSAALSDTTTASAAALDEVQLEVATFDMSTSEWLLASQRATLSIPASQSIVGEFHEDTVMAIVQDVWRRPLTEVSNVLAGLTDPAAAAGACSLARKVGDGEVAYDVVDCEGNVLSSIAAQGELDDQLSFAQEILASRIVAYVSFAGEPFIEYEFAPATFPAAFAPHSDGFVFASLDARDALQNPENFFATALESTLMAWDADSGEASELTSLNPFSAWTSRLVPLPDDRIAILSPNGGEVASAPFAEWSLVWDMPEGVSRVGVGLAQSRDRAGIKAILDDGSGVWVAHGDQPLELVDASPDTEVNDVLIVTSDRVLVKTRADGVEWLERG